MTTYGLIGYPLGHSFSRKFFTEKFEKEGIDAQYLNFEIPSIEEFPEIIKNNPELRGLNVTIPYKQQVMQYLDEISARFDAFLLSQSYRHEGTRYFCETDCQKTIAVFSHGGSGACVLSHLLSLPFPYVCTVLPYEFTSVITLEFPVRKGEYVHPRIELFNDAAHILNLSTGLRFQEKVD